VSLRNKSAEPIYVTVNTGEGLFLIDADTAQAVAYSRVDGIRTLVDVSGKQARYTPIPSQAVLNFSLEFSGSRFGQNHYPTVHLLRLMESDAQRYTVPLRLTIGQKL
jgi:hypothetical protein